MSFIFEHGVICVTRECICRPHERLSAAFLLLGSLRLVYYASRSCFVKRPFLERLVAAQRALFCMILRKLSPHVALHTQTWFHMSCTSDAQAGLAQERLHASLELPFPQYRLFEAASGDTILIEQDDTNSPVFSVFVHSLINHGRLRSLMFK